MRRLTAALAEEGKQIIEIDDVTSTYTSGVSKNIPAIPTATAARAKVGTNSRCPPE